MIVRYHYDEETLMAFARDEIQTGRDQMASHIESCEECQATLEKMVCSDLTWQSVSQLLTPCEFESHSELQMRLSFLKPSDNKHALGRFSRYEVLEILGHGGMGIVLRGFDPALNRQCAVKVLAPELAYHAAARKRFSREAKSAAAVVHPNVIPILTVDECDGIPYLVMPVVEGESLQQRVFRTGPLSILETVRIATQIADGLAAAHAQGLIHRDIKPGNILLGQGIERVQLTDFGLARAADDASRTRSGIIAGTPQYMSPEQARGAEIDQRSDLFSLGCVIYFMLSGRSPFRAESTMGVLHRIVNDEPRSLRTINSDVPLWLEEIAMKLLRKNPTERFASASELAKLLHDWQAHLQNPTESQPPKSYQPASSQRRKLITAGVLFISLALLLTAWFAYDRLRSINLNSPNLGQHPAASKINESLDEVHLDVDQLLKELK
jgi:eukaryotic-like serine/threonine-protein kinase